MTSAAGGCPLPRQQAVQAATGRDTTHSPQESPEWYGAGEYQRHGSDCDFVPRDSTSAIPFTCGIVQLTLKPGVSAAAVSDLIASLSGSVVSTLLLTRVTLLVRVPAGQERSAILSAASDPRVSKAGLDLHRRGAI
jgi:hypothetical protein